MPTLVAYKNTSTEIIPLTEQEIHVWSVHLDMPDNYVKKLQLYLAVDELQRAQRFYFKKDQNHFIVSRGILRKILSRYIDKQPYEFRFEYNKYGKPFLPNKFGDSEFQFNLSHSNGIALYAFACNHRVGIDIEFIRPEFSDLDIADRFFSPGEVAVLRSLPEQDQKQAFFLCWTRKEAFIKGKGRGLSIPLDQFDVSLTPGQPAELLKTRFDRKEASHWSLFNIDLFPGYAAALAVEGVLKWQVQFLEWGGNM